MTKPPTRENQYEPAYYDYLADRSTQSAAILLPIVVSQLAGGRPRSVLDVGCGSGSWLAVWRAMGVDTVRGIDGQWVALDQLAIPVECFARHDLETPYLPNERYDLAMSLEVAEHLTPDGARALVDALCTAAPVVLFSAAIPHQSGKHHINCQWPSYWADLFRERHGYQCVDSLRLAIWSDDRIDWWYRQNLMWFVSDASLLVNATVTPTPLPLVHPVMLKHIVNWGIYERRRYRELLEKTRATE